MANDTADQLKRTASLRAQVERLDHEEIRARANRTWLGRRLRGATIVLTVVLAVVLVADGWLAFDTFFR